MMDFKMMKFNNLNLLMISKIESKGILQSKINKGK